ncbi:MAG: hypothetical protein H6727_04060 [Myxococcales bacterium]|nr:hypothetical protein [Myxococcales bacterium]
MSQKRLPLFLFFMMLLLFPSFFSIGCQAPNDPRCLPISNDTDTDAGADNSKCCVALSECCAQIPEGNGDPNQDEKLICQKRADEGALITCQAEYQVLLAQQKCKVPSS